MTDDEIYRTEPCPCPPTWVASATYVARCPGGEPFVDGLPLWIQTGDATRTVSGLELLAKDSTGRTLLALHDNDGAGTPRFSRIKVTPEGVMTSTNVAWVLSALPVDLEALTSFNGEIFAATSAGRFIRLDFSPALPLPTVVALDVEVSLAGLGLVGDIEGVAIADIAGIIILAAASRGSNGVPAVIAWQAFDPVAMTFTAMVQSEPFTTPWPSGASVRHITDMRIDADGGLFVTSNTDPGSDGPFSSAVYRIGTFYKAGLQVELNLGEPIEYYRTEEHKAEAIARTPLQPGGMIIGADDENLGGFVFIEGERVLEESVGVSVTVTRQARSIISLEHAKSDAMTWAMRDAFAELSCKWVAKESAVGSCGKIATAFGESFISLSDAHNAALQKASTEANALCYDISY